jgi:hypothetical protein
MSKFDFGPREAEPRSLDTYYNILGDAQSITSAVSLIAPSLLQTRRYANAILSTGHSQDLAEARTDIRMRRVDTLREAVPMRIFVGAAALQHVHCGDKNVMLELLDSVQGMVAADIEAGDRSLTKVHIVPIDRIPVPPANLPYGMSLHVPRDVMAVETIDGSTYVMQDDGTTVDRIGDRGLRGRAAQYGMDRLAAWERMAVTGEAALQQIDESRAVLLAQ